MLGQAWEIFKQHWGPLLGAMVVAWLLSVIPSAIIGGIGGLVMGLNSGSAGSSDPSGAAAAGAMLIQSTGSLVSVVIQTFLQVGLMRMILAAARGQAPQFGDLFGGAAVFVPLLLTNLLFGLVVATATMCLIVPGVIAYCGLWMAPYYVVDANIRPVEALKTSWEAMKGQKGKFFVFLLLAGLIGIAGVLACGLGLFVAMPLVAIAMGVVFLRISGRGVPALSPAMAAPPGGYGGPPPGYGPPQGGGYGGPPPGGGYGPPGGGGYGGPQGGGGYGPQGGGGYGGPQGGGYGPGGGYGGPQGGGGGYGGPPPGGGGFPQR